jgi:hypothetical protein
MYQNQPICVDPYIRKVFGDDEHPLARKLLKTTFTVYSVRAREFYNGLQKKHWDEIQGGSQKYGLIKSIDLKEKRIICENDIITFDNMINTAPLDYFLKLCGQTMPLKSRSVCYYQIKADSVDLEGAEQALVSDLDIAFFKVQHLKDDYYLFWTFEPLENPYTYFGQFLGYKIDLVEAFRIENAIPIGEPPNLGGFECQNIFSVGSNAQWDDFMDIASCVKRLFGIRLQ